MSDKLTKCDNCGALNTVSKLDYIADFFARTEPGSEIPAGQCVKCGALSYVDEAPPVGPFQACSECGCTDVQATAWYDINTNKMNNDEGPLDTCWCPQCGEDGDGEFNGTVEVTELRPYDEARDLVAEGIQ